MKVFHLRDRVLVPTVAGELPGLVEEELEPGVYVVRLDDAKLPRFFVLAQELRLDTKHPRECDCRAAAPIRRPNADLCDYLPFNSLRR